MKIKFLLLFTLPFLSSCFLIPKRIHIGFDIDALSDQDILNASTKNEYHFDEIYRINDIYTFQHLHNYGFNSIQFVNLYDPSGNLLRSKSGTHCEIELMSYMKDSLKLGNYMSSIDDSSNYMIVMKTKCHPILSANKSFSSELYHVVVGWSCFANKRSIFSGRVKSINDMIPELKKNNIQIVVVGLNLDPPLNNEGN